jgi:hypothetical protein
LARVMPVISLFIALLPPLWRPYAGAFRLSLEPFPFRWNRNGALVFV